MRALMLVILAGLSSFAFADRDEEFVGRWRSVKGGDCEPGVEYKIVNDAKQQILLFTQFGDGGGTIEIPTHIGAKYYMNFKTKKMTIVRGSVALNEDEVSRGFGDGFTRSVSVDHVEFEGDVGTEVEGFETREISVSKDKKRLIHSTASGDYSSDPHEEICEFEKIR